MIYMFSKDTPVSIYTDYGISYIGLMGEIYNDEQGLSRFINIFPLPTKKLEYAQSGFVSPGEKLIVYAETLIDIKSIKSTNKLIIKNTKFFQNIKIRKCIIWKDKTGRKKKSEKEGKNKQNNIRNKKKFGKKRIYWNGEGKKNFISMQ